MLSYHWRALANEFGQVELLESGQTQLKVLEPEWVDDHSILALFGPNAALVLCLQVWDPFHDRMAITHLAISPLCSSLDAFALRVRLIYIELIESLKSAAMGGTKAD
jgi:hypothetical protein